jgi:hypothetical protein
MHHDSPYVHLQHTAVSMGLSTMRPDRQEALVTGYLAAYTDFGSALPVTATAATVTGAWAGAAGVA